MISVHLLIGRMRIPWLGCPQIAGCNFLEELH